MDDSGKEFENCIANDAGVSNRRDSFAAILSKYNTLNVSAAVKPGWTQVRQKTIPKPEIDGRGETATKPAHPSSAFPTTRHLFDKLRESDSNIDEEIQRCHDELRTIRQEIISASRSNFILERELDTIDEKIKLLVKNRISLQDVISSVQVSDRTSTGLLDPKKRAAYEHVLYTLQSEPIYFAKLARVVSGNQIQSFVQTVVFDFYGDQYDTRDERLLLSLFGHILHAEFSSALSMGSLLRANTAVTNMMTAYSRRGPGLSILSDILSEPLKRITSETSLDLELNPVAVYKDMISQRETETGQSFTGPRDCSYEECCKNPEVAELLESRRARLIELATDILQRICNNVEHVPYGMRWICKKLKDLSTHFFPGADNRRVGSMVGGYIYLRFFNPVVVTPDALDFVRGKVSKKMRRNLILIAKLLQNLSNDLKFGEKEPYMTECNSFIESSRDMLDRYFERLVDVNDLSTQLAMDKWLERTNRRETQIQVSFNQLFLLHSLLETHIDLLCGDDNPSLRHQIMQLGPAPKQLKSQENHTVGIELHPYVAEFSVDALTGMPRERVPSTDDTLQCPDGHPLFQDAARLLVQLAQAIPPELSDRPCLESVIQVVQESSSHDGNEVLSTLVNSLSDVLITLKRMLLLPEHNGCCPFDGFLTSVCDSIESRESRLEAVSQRRMLASKVCSTILSHHQYLDSRLSLYRQYLDNVRSGRTATLASDAPNVSRSKTAPMRFKISQTELESSGVIIAVDPDVRRGLLKKTSFTFTATSNPNQFMVTALYSKARAPLAPILIDLEELLDMQSNNQVTINVPNMVLNVNLLIYLINSKFLAAHYSSRLLDSR
uniref:Ras-GAP domain-containing protein n=1 Tax=Spongospora subterranea TaxID=70186 RepID=A0A0H5R9X1_9EUKA|eukprot:CRZ10888.1 hypothetical protein [Spongospora subterranea]